MSDQIDYIPTEAPVLPFERVSLTDAGKVMGFYTAKLGRAPTKEEALERLDEEIDELIDAIDFEELGCCGDGDCPCKNQNDAEHILKECVDVYYTILGYCLSRGWDFGSAFKAVHASNMTKQPTESGKVIKGPDYVEPDLSGCV